MKNLTMQYPLSDDQHEIGYPPIRSKQYSKSLALAGLVLGCAVALPAMAGGVEYAHVQADSVNYPVAGQSNIINVMQTVDEDGNLRYSHIYESDVKGEPIWFGVKYEAKCTSNYRLHAASLKVGYSYASGDGPYEVSLDYAESQTVNTDHMTIPWRHADFDVPFNEFQSLIEPAFAQDLVWWGNFMADAAVAQGEDETLYRAQDRNIVVNVPIAFQVFCRKYAGGNKIKADGDSYAMPLTVRYVGATSGPSMGNPNPVPPPSIDPELTTEVQVTQAQLFAIPMDSDEACGLNLSGVLTTTDQTMIEYRLVNQLGIKSQTFQVPVDQTFTAYFNHPIDLSDPAFVDDGELDLVIEDDHGGDIDDLIDEETDRLKGYYQVEVLSPHHKMSNVASYNMPACETELDLTKRN